MLDRLFDLAAEKATHDHPEAPVSHSPAGGVLVSTAISQSILLNALSGFQKHKMEKPQLLLRS